MTGTVKNDGSVFFPENPNFEKIWNVAGPAILGVAGSSNRSETTPEEFTLANIILKFYNGGRYNLLEAVQEFVDMMTDALFLSPDQKFAELASNYVPVYNYQLTYKGSQSYLIYYLAYYEEEAEAFENLVPVHADDNLHLFNEQGLGERNKEDERVSKMMSLYWTNFAKYRDPSPVLKDNLTQWNCYSTEQRYMDIGLKAEMKSGIEQERMTFWQKIYWNEVFATAS
jgi:carboxylesterase type B